MVQAKADITILARIVGRLDTQRIQFDAGAFTIFRARFNPRPRTRGYAVLESGGREVIVNQSPLSGARSLKAFGERRKDVGAVAANFALVHQSRQPARARQNA